MSRLWVSQEPQRSLSAGQDPSLQQGMVSTAKETYRAISTDTKYNSILCYCTVWMYEYLWGLCTRRSNSAKMHPTAHMSTPTPYILAPNRSSGERYHLGKGSINRELNFTTGIQCTTLLVRRSILLNYNEASNSGKRNRDAAIHGSDNLFSIMCAVTHVLTSCTFIS